MTKVPVHELDKKANKLALTIAHKHNRSLQIIKSYNFIQQIKIQSIKRTFEA